MVCRSRKCHPNREAGDEEEKQATRGEPDLLRQDYESVVECLITCESIIQDLERELAARDSLVKSLEDRIVHMSIDLASTKAREDALQHRLERSFAGARKGEEPPSQSKKGEEPPSQALVAFSRAMYRPVSSRGKREIGNRPGDRAGPQSGSGKEDPSGGGVERGLASSTGAANNSDGTTRSAAASGDGNALGSVGAAAGFGAAAWSAMTLDAGNVAALDATNTSRLANFGKFFLKNLSRECEKETTQVPEVEAKAEVVARKEKRGPNDVGGERYRRRPAGRGKTELQISLKGVLFPVSSIEIIKKGCLSSSSLDLLKRGGGARKYTKGGSNEEWPQFG